MIRTASRPLAASSRRCGSSRRCRLQLLVSCDAQPSVLAGRHAHTLRQGMHASSLGSGRCTHADLTRGEPADGAGAAHNPLPILSRDPALHVYHRDQNLASCTPAPHRTSSFAVPLSCRQPQGGRGPHEKRPGRAAQGTVLVTSPTFALPTRLADGFGRKVALLAVARFTPNWWVPRSARGCLADSAPLHLSQPYYSPVGGPCQQLQDQR
jgi:hypothetical protein